MSPTHSTRRPRFVPVTLQPHLLFFWVYNLIYLLPLITIYLWGYIDAGAIGQISLDSHSFQAILFIYAQGLLAFSVGSVFVSLLLRSPRRWNAIDEFPSPDIGITEKLGIVLLAAMFVGAKAALIPLDAYHGYVFANDLEFKSGIWSFSMVCSEFLLLAATLMLFSNSRRNLLGFLLLSLINCVNLLHGTRIIFVVNLLILLLYAYVRGFMTLKRVLILGPLSFIAVLLLAYAVFLSRSGVNVDRLTAANAASPLVYESLFSQISLRNVVNSSDVMNSTGSLPNLVSDVVLGVMPRVLVPEKDELQYLQRFSYMSPFGAFNGYAAGLIYLGVFWPVFYLLLGGAASWLHAKARSNGHWLVLYAYFTGDVLFRFMRDGYTIPIKILVNIIELLVLLLLFRALIRGLPRRAPQTR
jgi:hypothetical protein